MLTIDHLCTPVVCYHTFPIFPLPKFHQHNIYDILLTWILAVSFVKKIELDHFIAPLQNIRVCFCLFLFDVEKHI